MPDQEDPTSEPAHKPGDTPELESEAVEPPEEPIAVPEAAKESAKPDTAETPDEVAKPKPHKSGEGNIFKRLLDKAKAKKAVSIPLAILAVLLLLLAIPFTRYPLAGLVLKKNFSVVITDKDTGNPVSSASVMLDGKTALTDNTGKATVRSRVGHKQLSVTKKYYKDQTTKVTVGILSQKNRPTLNLQATGRQILITARNKITFAALADAVVSASGTEAKTDKSGKVSMVLPADKPTVEATISASGFNDTKVSIKISDVPIEENNFDVTPAGKIYFLSKKSGTIDVVKTDLDGGNRVTVLAGSGKEDDTDTVLLASRDWKYLALKAKRDDGKPKLYLIDAATDKLSTIDEGDVTFTPVGWQNEYFVYSVLRSTQIWTPKREAVKSFNAATGKITTLDELSGQGTNNTDYASEQFTATYIVDGWILYGKYWTKGYNQYLTNTVGKHDAIIAVHADGTGKKTLKEIDANTSNNGNRYIDSRPYEAQGVYFSMTKDDGNGNLFYTVERDELKDSDITQDKFYGEYNTYLVSPEGKQTFWSESRDGKNVMLVGDLNGENGKQIASLSDEFSPYGWFGEGYLLVSKKGSELYIIPASGPKPGADLLKVSDYHKPAYSFRGYGYGYGGN